jgi:hypothetical protein
MPSQWTAAARPVGKASSANFPAQQPLQGRAGLTDAFVTLLQWNAATSQLSYAYSTVLGGTQDDAANGIALDTSGNALLTGSPARATSRSAIPSPIGSPARRRSS